MATTTFYTHLTNPTVFACRLAQKVYKSDQNVLVWLPDEKSLHKFDQALWSFDSTSFVPHDIWLSEKIQPNSVKTVILACGVNLPLVTDFVIINLADIYWFEAPHPPQRVLELVSTDLDELAAARQRFRTYRDAGYSIEHYDMRKKG